jgi:hypothetical protein
VVARTWPDAYGAWMIDLGAGASTARAIQKAAAAAHGSQSPALPQLTRRLDLLDERQYLRWLVPPLRERRLHIWSTRSAPGLHRTGVSLRGRAVAVQQTGRPSDSRRCLRSR